MAAKQKINIIVIAVGNWLDMYELMSIASYPMENHLIHVDDFAALQSITSSLKTTLCDGAKPCDSNPCQNGGTCITSLTTYICECPPGKGGEDCSSECPSPADIVFVLDASGSIGDANFHSVVAFIQSVVSGLPLGPNFRIGMLTFGDTPKVYFELDTYTKKIDVLNALSIPFYSGGSTNTADAIKEMTKFFDGVTGAKIGVVVTDGRSNEPDLTWEAAREAREKDILVLAVGIGANAKLAELEAIASHPVEANVFRVSDFDALDIILDRFVSTMCDADDECASAPCPEDQCVDLRNGFKCKCALNKAGQDCSLDCDGTADILIVMDTSGSIRRERFSEAKTFMIDVIRSFEWNEERIQLALVSFSDVTKVEFKFETFIQRQDEIEALRRLVYVGGKTNIASALVAARDEIFTEANGDRPDVPNYIFYFTDGGANIDAEMVVPESIATRQFGVHITTISVGRDLNVLMLKAMASEPVERNVITVPSFDNLDAALVQKVATNICDLEKECAKSPCQNGGTCIDGLGMYLCMCVGSFVGKHCETDCGQKTDVIIVLDISRSVSTSYDLSIKFIEELVLALGVDTGANQVAMVTFSDESDVRFKLNEYQSAVEILTVVTFFNQGGKTNTAAALKAVQNDVLASGDRADAANAVVVISDGASTINQEETIPAATALKADGAIIFTVGLGEKPNTHELQAMASQTEAPFVQNLKTDEDVATIVQALLAQFCSEQ